MEQDLDRKSQGSYEDNEVDGLHQGVSRPNSQGRGIFFDDGGSSDEDQYDLGEPLDEFEEDQLNADLRLHTEDNGGRGYGYGGALSTSDERQFHSVPLPHRLALAQQREKEELNMQYRLVVLKYLKIKSKFSMALNLQGKWGGEDEWGVGAKNWKREFGL